MSLLTRLSFLSILIAPLAAQTFTSCNPLNSTNCPEDPALGMNHTYDFTQASAGSTWNTTAGTLQYGADGAAFVINQKGDAPTIQTNFYILFGEVEVWMKAAAGKGVCSSIVLQSDDLDEIDLEIIGSNTTHAENNYYGKGNTTNEASKARWEPMSSPPQTDFHNYTTRWTNETLEWYIDGNLTRTLKYADAEGGKNYPQTPMQLKMGVWAAGDREENNYTRAWAGGEIDYSKGPYTMTIRSARLKDYTTGSSYKYSDKSGSSQSITITPGNSTTQTTLSRPPAQTAQQKWAGLSPTAKISVYSVAGAAAAATVLLFGWYCVRQRKRGVMERRAEEAGMVRDREVMEKDREVLLEFQGKGL